MLEVDELFEQNYLSVAMDGATACIERRGLFDFNGEQPFLKGLDGKALTIEGDRGWT